MPGSGDWAFYDGEQVLRDAVGVPQDWMLAGRVVVGWLKGRHGPLRRRPLAQSVSLDAWDGAATDLVGG